MTPDIVAVELPIDDVYPNPRHYREVRAENVKTLAASIKVAGQLDPITVYRDGDIYFVDAGHHRLEAVKALGLKTIRAIVLDDVDEAKSATIMTASNMHFPESAIEKSRGSQLLLTTGVKPVNVAALVGVDQNTVSMAAKGLAMAKDYAEDMTLERLAVLPEFEGDEEAVHKIMTAGEDRWRGVYNDLSRKKKLDAEAEAAKKIIEAAGCKVIAASDIDRTKMEWLGSDQTAPKGAKYGVVNRSYVNVWIGWWKKAGKKTVDTEEQARQERAALIAAQLAEAKALRIEFLLNHLTGNGAVVRLDGLSTFSRTAWEGGYAASSNTIHEGLSSIQSFVPRVHAAILSRVDSLAHEILTNPHCLDAEDMALTVAYFKALKEVDYKPIPAETERLDEIVDALAGDPCEECHGGDGDE